MVILVIIYGCTMINKHNLDLFSVDMLNNPTHLNIFTFIKLYGKVARWKEFIIIS